MSRTEPIVVRGVLGWSNRKGGLEAYGPGGRWGGEGDNAKYGDLLGDALERERIIEGADLIVVCLPRLQQLDSPLVARRVESLLAEMVGALQEGPAA